MSVAAAASAACGRKRATGFNGFAYVANEEGHAIAAVDLTAFAVVRHVRLDASPTEVIAHPEAPSILTLTPSTGAIHEIDGGRLTLTGKMQAGNTALSMRMPYLAPGMLLAAYREPRRLAAFSVPGKKLEWQVPLAEEPVDFDVTPDGKYAAVSFGASGRIGLLDTAARKVEILETGTAVGMSRFRSDGKALMVAARDANQLLIYDVARRGLVVKLPLAVRPDQVSTSRDGGQIFVTGEGHDAVVVVYPYQTEVAETVLAGRQPGAMAASSGKPPYLFIANPSSGDVTIMNITTRKVVAIASVGAEPGFITITPDNQFALVLNRKSGDMGVLRIHDKLATRQKSAGLFTMIPVGSRPVCAAIRQV